MSAPLGNFEFAKTKTGGLFSSNTVSIAVKFETSSLTKVKKNVMNKVSCKITINVIKHNLVIGRQRLLKEK